MNKYKGETIVFNSYVNKKTGLIQNRTLIKSGDHFLNCIPYHLSFNEITVLVVLNQTEAIFFERYLNKLASVSFYFHKKDEKEPVKLFARGTLLSINPLPGKQNVYLFKMEIRSCPNELVLIIGDFLAYSTLLKSQFESYKGTLLPLEPNLATLLGYNNYAEAITFNNKVRVELKALGVDNISILVQNGVISIKEGDKLGVKLYFRKYQFPVIGKIRKIEKVDNASLVTIEIHISFELTEILDQFFFQLKTQKKE